MDAAQQVVPPEGFTLEPQPPPGFKLEGAAPVSSAAPKPPPGFTLEARPGPEDLDEPDSLLTVLGRSIEGTPGSTYRNVLDAGRAGISAVTDTAKGVYNAGKAVVQDPSILTSGRRMFDTMQGNIPEPVESAMTVASAGFKPVTAAAGGLTRNVAQRTFGASPETAQNLGDLAEMASVLPMAKIAPEMFGVHDEGGVQGDLERVRSGEYGPGATPEDTVLPDVRRLPDGSPIRAAAAEVKPPEGFVLEQPAAPVERRILDRRVAEMSPAEKNAALLRSDKVDLPNARAYREAPRLPVQVKSDVDGLKWVNDNLGDEAGDALLQAKADALAKEGVDAYHLHGDTFVSQFATPEEAEATMRRVKARLADGTFAWEDPNGERYEFKGAGFSYGIGDSVPRAGEAMDAQRDARLSTGERASRGERPPGLVDVSAEGGQAEAGRPVDVHSVQVPAGFSLEPPANPSSRPARIVARGSALPREDVEPIDAPAFARIAPTPEDLSDLSAAARARGGTLQPDEVPPSLEVKIAARKHLLDLANVLEGAEGTVGRYRSVDVHGNETWLGQKSPLPKQDQWGYGYREIRKIIYKGLGGDTLAPRQAEYFDHLTRRAIQEDGPISFEALDEFIGEHGLPVEAVADRTAALERRALTEDRGDTSFDPQELEKSPSVPVEPPLPKYAGSINLERLSNDEAVRRSVANLSEDIQRQGTITHEQLRAEAEASGFQIADAEKFAKATTQQRSDFIAARQLTERTNERLVDVKNRLAGLREGTPEYRQTLHEMKDAMTEALRATRVNQEIAHNAGAALSSFRAEPSTTAQRAMRAINSLIAEIQSKRGVC